MTNEQSKIVLDMAEEPSKPKKSKSVLDTIKSLKPDSGSQEEARKSQSSKGGFTPTQSITTKQQKKEEKSTMSKTRRSNRSKDLAKEANRQRLKYEQDLQQEDAQEIEEEYYEVDGSYTYLPDESGNYIKQIQENIDKDKVVTLYDQTGKLMHKSSTSEAGQQEQKEITIYDSTGKAIDSQSPESDPWEATPVLSAKEETTPSEFDSAWERSIPATPAEGTTAMAQSLEKSQQAKEMAAQELKEDRHQQQQERILTTPAATPKQTQVPEQQPAAPASKPEDKPHANSRKEKAPRKKGSKIILLHGIYGGLIKDMKRFGTIAGIHILGTLIFLPGLLFMGPLTAIILAGFLAADLWIQKTFIGFETFKAFAGGAA